MKKKENQPKKVVKLHCSNCGELLVKIYPWAPLELTVNANKVRCTKKKCSSPGSSLPQASRGTLASGVQKRGIFGRLRRH